MPQIACEMSRREKLTETENRLAVAKSWEQSVCIIECGMIFWRDKNIPELNKGNC